MEIAFLLSLYREKHKRKMLNLISVKLGEKYSSKEKNNNMVDLSMPAFRMMTLAMRSRKL